MKLPCAIILPLLATVTAFAEFKVPAGVYRVAELDVAMNEAAKLKKPLFIVHSDDTYTRPPLPEIQDDTLKAGKDWAVTVFVSWKEGFFALPPPVLGALTGGHPPIVYITSPEGDKVWKVIMPSGRAIDEPAVMRKHVRAEINACKAEIAAWFASKPPHGPELPGDKSLNWPHADGHIARVGVFGKVKNERLLLRGDNEDIPNIGIPLANLHPATVRYLRYITGATKPKETEKPAPALEKWTNASGKTLEANFVSLKDGKVTLRTAAGKEHTLALDTLSEESQKRARQLAGSGTRKD